MICTQVEASLPHAIVVANHTPPTLGAFEVQGLGYCATQAIRCCSKFGSAVFPRAKDVAARLVAVAAQPRVRAPLAGETRSLTVRCSECVHSASTACLGGVPVILFRATLGGCCAYRRSDAELAEADAVFRRAWSTARRARTAPGYCAVGAWGSLDVARWLRAYGLGASDVGPFMTRARIKRGPDLLRLDDDELVRIGVASKLRRRAMLASLDQFRDRPTEDPQIDLEPPTSTVNASALAAWERVSATTTDDEGIAVFVVANEGTFVAAHVPDVANPPCTSLLAATYHAASGSAVRVDDDSTGAVDLTLRLEPKLHTLCVRLKAGDCADTFAAENLGDIPIILVTRRRRTQYVVKTGQDGVATFRIPTDDYVLAAGMVPIRACDAPDHVTALEADLALARRVGMNYFRGVRRRMQTAARRAVRQRRLRRRVGWGSAVIKVQVTRWVKRYRRNRTHAISGQTVVRGFLQRVRLANLRWTAVRVQSLRRRVVATRVVAVRRVERNRVAALRIQTAARGALLRARFATNHRAATRVQAFRRGIAAKRVVAARTKGIRRALDALLLAFAASMSASALAAATRTAAEAWRRERHAPVVAVAPAPAPTAAPAPAQTAPAAAEAPAPSSLACL